MRLCVPLCDLLFLTARVVVRPWAWLPPPRRIVFESGRTGFEEVKDFNAPIGTLIAGRCGPCVHAKPVFVRGRETVAFVFELLLYVTGVLRACAAGSFI